MPEPHLPIPRARNRFARRVTAALLCAGACVSATGAERRLNTQTNTWNWTQVADGFSIELVQLHGDYVSAVFGSKGFTEAMLDELGRYCYYGTIVRNVSDEAIHMRVADWFARTADGRDVPLKTKADWIADWAAAGVPFKWLMLADDVTFEKNDWIQGFSSVQLPRDAKFDFHYVWHVEGQRHEAVINDVECPPAHLPAR
ncbi:MAG: hypothetical protein KDG50_05825 [Chromatiales bacterium]|nr:hypothetical protein [Chromatiales bacterium]